MDDTTKVSVLMHALEHSSANYLHLGNRSQTLFSWIGSVYLAVLGVIAALGPGAIAAFGAGMQIGLSIACASLFIFSWVSEILFFRARLAEAEASVRIAGYLHLFEAGFFGQGAAVFDKSEWVSWHKDPLRRFGLTQHTSVLFVLAALVVAAIWGS